MPIGTYLETEVPFFEYCDSVATRRYCVFTQMVMLINLEDQKEKKYKYKPLIESLIKHSNLSMEEQK